MVSCPSHRVLIKINLQLQYKCLITNSFVCLCRFSCGANVFGNFIMDYLIRNLYFEIALTIRFLLKIKWL